MSKLQPSLETEGIEEGVGKSGPEMLLFDDIFETACKFDSPQLPYQIINFSLQCEIVSRNMFPEGFWEVFSEYQQTSKS